MYIYVETFCDRITCCFYCTHLQKPLKNADKAHEDCRTHESKFLRQHKSLGGKNAHNR